MRKPKPEFLPKKGELYLTYNEKRTGGNPKNPNDRWTSHDDELIEFSPTGLFTQKCNYQETIDIPEDPASWVGKTVYVVIVRYFDGGTFGRICGKWSIVGAFTEEAQVNAAVKVIQDSTSESGSRRKSAEEETAYQAVMSGLQSLICPNFYPSWFGYFSGFEGIEVHQFTLKDKNPLADLPHSSSVKWIRH